MLEANGLESDLANVSLDSTSEIEGSDDHFVAPDETALAAALAEAQESEGTASAPAEAAAGVGQEPQVGVYGYGAWNGDESSLVAGVCNIWGHFFFFK